MASPAREVERRWNRDGSIFALKALNPDQIADSELAWFWGKAQEALKEFERAEDEIVRILDHRYAKGWS